MDLTRRLNFISSINRSKNNKSKLNTFILGTHDLPKSAKMLASGITWYPFVHKNTNLEIRPFWLRCEEEMLIIFITL